MEQDRGSGIIRRVIRSTASWAGMVAAANLAVTGTAHADVASEMNSFFSDAGGAANVTGPSAFQGQSAGYYSLGNVWTRFPQKSVQPFNLQLPSARAGCGGIDLLLRSAQPQSGLVGFEHHLHFRAVVGLHLPQADDLAHDLGVIADRLGFGIDVADVIGDAFLLFLAAFDSLDQKAQAVVGDRKSVV